MHRHCSPGSDAVAVDMAWVKAIAGQAQLEDRCFHCGVNGCCGKGMPCWIFRSEDGTNDCSKVGGVLGDVGDASN